MNSDGIGLSAKGIPESLRTWTHTSLNDSSPSRPRAWRLAAQGSSGALQSVAATNSEFAMEDMGVWATISMSTAGIKEPVAALEEFMRSLLRQQSRDASPGDRAQGWLEALVTSMNGGRLDPAVFSVSIAALLGGRAVGVWRAGAAGTYVGGRDDLRPLGPDVRIAALRRRGAAIPFPRPKSAAGQTYEEATSLGFLGSGEWAMHCARCTLEDGDSVVILGRSLVPFGPWKTQGQSAETWASDAGWKHGMRGCGVVVGFASPAEMLWPAHWEPWDRDSAGW